MSNVEAGCGEGYGGEEVAGELVIARGDGTEVFELVEEALDEVAFAVESWVDRAFDPHIALAGDMGRGAAGLDHLDDGAGEVAPVGDDVAGKDQPIEQVRRGGLVGSLAGGEQEAHGQAVGIDDDVDLGAQSTPRSSDGVIRTPFFPPAACWWARTIEESIR